MNNSIIDTKPLPLYTMRFY